MLVNSSSRHQHNPAPRIAFRDSVDDEGLDLGRRCSSQEPSLVYLYRSPLRMNTHEYGTAVLQIPAYPKATAPRRRDEASALRQPSTGSWCVTRHSSVRKSRGLQPSVRGVNASHHRSLVGRTLYASRSSLFARETACMLSNIPDAVNLLSSATVRNVFGAESSPFSTERAISPDLGHRGLSRLVRTAKFHRRRPIPHESVSLS